MSQVRATCTACGEGYAAPDLFGLPPSCRCGGALLLDDEAPGLLDDDRPTIGDRLDDRPTTDAADRAPPAPMPPRFHDLPTTADADAPPYEQAAFALDPSATSRRARSEVIDEHGRARAPALVPGSRTHGERSEPHTGRRPGAGSERVKPPALTGTPANRAPPLPELDDLVEVVEVAGTQGRGSRTFEAPRRPTSSTRLPRVTAPLTPPPFPPAQATGLFGRGDVDWLALIDDNLPELPVPDPSSTPRVILHVPESAAPTAEADADQVAQFQAAVRALESGAAPIGALLGGASPAGSQAIRPAKRFASGVEELSPAEVAALAPRPKPETTTVPRPKPETTTAPRPFPSGRAPRPEADDTRGWQDRGRPSARLAPAAPGRVVEELLHADLDPGLVCARDAGSVEADDVRQLFQRVFHAPRAGGPPRVVLVTSPDPGAGKTTVAANLAIVGARIPGRGAVLVDADPRGRGVLRAFGVRSQSEGLLEALQQDQRPERAVLQFNLGALDVVPLGIPSSNAAELIGSDRMATFLGRLRERAGESVIIIDGSSVLHAADPLVLARLVDGVVLVVRAGRTSRDAARRAVELLGPERIIGVVLDGAAAARG